MNYAIVTCYDPTGDGDQMCLDSSVGRAPARIAVGPRFDSSFGHYLLLRSVVIRSRCWT